MILGLHKNQLSLLFLGICCGGGREERGQSHTIILIIHLSKVTLSLSK